MWECVRCHTPSASSIPAWFEALVPAPLPPRILVTGPLPTLGKGRCCPGQRPDVRLARWWWRRRWHRWRFVAGIHVVEQVVVAGAVSTAVLSWFSALVVASFRPWPSASGPLPTGAARKKILEIRLGRCRLRWVIGGRRLVGSAAASRPAALVSASLPAAGRLPAAALRFCRGLHLWLLVVVRSRREIVEKMVVGLPPTPSRWCRLRGRALGRKRCPPGGLPPCHGIWLRAGLDRRRRRALSEQPRRKWIRGSSSRSHDVRCGG